ncbi:uncharacterized protein TNCV_2149841 [Trichonephila clavipes]|nr:uncharacterized protein TNCV_2149841 [Trichonephila clavipes]
MLHRSCRSQKKDHVPGLGRGPCSISNLRSPNSLKIIQFNIKGISTSATRIKLDRVHELPLTKAAQITALQETKLKTFKSLKMKGDTISLASAGRKKIFENRDTGRSNHVWIELNKINAKIKRLYAQIKRDKWNDLCSSLDSRTSDGKLWKLLKNISNEQPQAEQCNTILNEDGNLAVNDEQAADLLGLHDHKISRLNFSVEDRNIKIKASRIVHGCRSNTHRGTFIFSTDFRVNELEAAIGDSCLNRSLGPDGIPGQMIDCYRVQF